VEVSLAENEKVSGAGEFHPHALIARASATLARNPR
jgi:hypothetical protein